MIAPSKLTRCSLLSAFWKAAGSLGVVLSLVVATPIVAAGTPAVESTDATAWPQDRDFLTARAAFERRDLKALQEINQRLKASASAHPLTPYVRAWWLSANLAQSASFAITQNEDFVTFLAANPDTPYADNLRKEWLRLLGQQAAWELFTLGLNKAALEDPEIACHHWRLRLSQGDQTVYSEARTAWNAARSAPEACYTVFENLVTAKPLTPDEGWQRLRKLLAAGLLNDARRSAALIKGAPVNFERNTAIINLDAVRYLEREKLDRRSPASIELFLFAITRAARSDARRAAGLLTKRGDALPPQDLAYAWNQIGLYAAMQHDPDALTWFAQGASTTKAIPLTDNQAAWKIRAALRAADWQTVRQTIRALPSSEQRDPAWRYWLARALDESDKTTANSLRSGLAQEPHFYGLLAAEELGTSRAPNWQVWQPTRAEIEEMASRASIRRTLALYRLGLNNEGLREWQYALRAANDQELLAAAAVAQAADLPDRAISAAERTQALHDLSQRFPTPYRHQLQTSAQNYRLDESWVYGLIRQESRFKADIQSRAGAIGLMQLMPTTARWAAKQAGIKDFSLTNTTHVATNLELGSYYLRHVLDSLGHPVLATAAYNAGPSRAKRWKAQQPLEGAIYAETIPFNETRDYVKKVMTNAWFYAYRLGGANISLKNIMGTVPGKSAGIDLADSGASVLPAPATP